MSNYWGLWLTSLPFIFLGCGILFELRSIRVALERKQ